MKYLRSSAFICGLYFFPGFAQTPPPTSIPDIKFSTGQDVVPVFEGWIRNRDGSFDMVFGYFNRNFKEDLAIPAGPENTLDPGPPDRGQPTYFLPRRHAFVFRVRVPADWGQKALVWTITSHGHTEKAYGELLPVEEITERIIMTRGNLNPGDDDPNKPPEIKIAPIATASVATPLNLTALVTDDGLPKPRPAPKPRSTSNPTGQINTTVSSRPRGLNVTWFEYRGPAKVDFDPAGLIPVANGKALATARFGAPGAYVLRATANDGALSIITDVTVEVAQSTAAESTSLPNPYRTIENWAKLPEGRTWGSTSAVDIDRDGKSIWVAERCGANSCAGKTEPPILKFDSSGKLVKSFGSGMFIFPHGICVDKDGNIWVTDGQGKDGIGHQAFKFSPEGKVLMTLGKAGIAGDGEDTFNQPNDVAIAPNGDIFVSDGHSSGRGNARVVKFDKDGKFIKQWGGHGSAPGQFEVPHALAFDSKGRLFVGDRGNNRIQIFDQDGKFLEEWTQFSRPSGIYIDKNDVIYVADSESNANRHPGWKRGIRIGSAKDGSVTAFIPDPADPPPSLTSAAEGVAADATGNIYGAEVGPKDLKKYIRK